MTKKEAIKIFEEKESTYGSGMTRRRNGTFSMSDDVVSILTESVDGPGRYWNKLKQRLEKEGRQMKR